MHSVLDMGTPVVIPDFNTRRILSDSRSNLVISALGVEIGVEILLFASCHKNWNK